MAKLKVGNGMDAGVTTGPLINAEAVAKVVDHALWLSDLHPGRLIPFGGIDPQRPEAVDLVQEWFARGVRGLKLHPSCG